MKELLIKCGAYKTDEKKENNLPKNYDGNRLVNDHLNRWLISPDRSIWIRLAQLLSLS